MSTCYVLDRALVDGRRIHLFVGLLLDLTVVAERAHGSALHRNRC